MAADHAGFELKEKVKKYLESKGHEVVDMGAYEYIEEDDYPEYMIQAANQIATDPDGGTRAVIFGGSGQGEAMVSNRFPGVRAAVWYGGDVEILKKSREHNDANVLSIGARFVNEGTIEEEVQLWLDTAFSGEEKHSRRIVEMDSIE